MTKIFLTVLWAMLILAMSVAGDQAGMIEHAARLNGGVIVVLDSEDPDFVIALAAHPSLRIQVLLEQAAEVETFRASLVAAGAYGPISVNAYDGTALPYVDHLVNMLVCSKDTRVEREELWRVIAPHGSLYVVEGDTHRPSTKPVPKGMDEWNQFLHNAANNGVSRDDVGPPQRMRWHNTPENGRAKALMPSVTCMVTAQGILYTIEDRASPEDVNAPFEYHLVARDAFNGIELWKQPIKEWVKGGNTLGIKSVSSQLQRRLVALDDHVYFPMRFDSPVSRLDGRSGKAVKLLRGTESTREIAIEQNIMYGIQGDGYGLISEAAAKEKRRSGESAAPAREVTLYAYDLRSNQMLWTQPVKPGYVGASLSVNQRAIAYLTDMEVVCLNKQTGTVQWASPLGVSKSKPKKTKKGKKPNPALGKVSVPGEDNNMHATLVLAPNKALCAYGSEIAAYSLLTGDQLWTCPNDSNYMKSPEIFVTGGVLWNKQLKAINLKTGKVVKELSQEMMGPMSHDRCYRNRVTHQYYLNSASGGIDFVGLDGKSEHPAPWVRSTCGLSAMPANGMVYNGPFVCQCAIGSMLTGFNALYHETPGRFTVTHTPRLEKGPAYDKALGDDPEETDWPTYRQSAARSAISSSRLPDRMAPAWVVNIGNKPTAPVIVDQHVYVASQDTHTLYALDRKTGKTLWTFITGGGIDSPPTYYKGMLLTGCRDGWVYGIDAADGTLRWRFNGLPVKRLIVDRGQLESAWPVNGSVLVEQEIAYFAAGRSSYLDGGISVFGLNPATGEMIHHHVINGPYETERATFPTRGIRRGRLTGFKSGIFSVAHGKLFLRHQAFNPDLTPVSLDKIREPHLIASPGFLNSVPQHRTYWTVDVDLSYGGPTAVTGYGPLGDTTAYAAGEFFEIRGYSPGRNLAARGAKHTPFNTHSVFAGKLTKAKEGDVWVSRKGKTIPEVGTWGKNWSTPTPFAGHAISVCANAVMVAGVPLTEGQSQEDTVASFKGEKGGVLWMMDKVSGKQVQAFTLPAPPAWDSIAIAHEMCVLSLKDGSVMALSAAD